MSKNAVDMTNILNKTIVVGLNYFDNQNNPLKTNQLVGTVVEAHEQDGITLLLSNEKREFTIPSDLSAWFNTLDESYQNSISSSEFNTETEVPDYLVSWNVYQKQRSVADKVHQWWDWIPKTSSPDTLRKLIERAA